ncbi:hypothetical protein ACQKPE_07445 [Pseudomonas sp. NPDC089554]|uniref:hypothetical protein n=1 Tax=Pseudomonas sp. NPDC089554 TaxID=3390653 RepID=UPI003D08084B
MQSNSAVTAKNIKVNDYINGQVVSRKIWTPKADGDYNVSIRFLDVTTKTESKFDFSVTLAGDEVLDDLLATGDEVSNGNYFEVIRVSYDQHERVITRFMAFR